jgi:hypothetical protein
MTADWQLMLAAVGLRVALPLLDEHWIEGGKVLAERHVGPRHVGPRRDRGR